MAASILRQHRSDETPYGSSTAPALSKTSRRRTPASASGNHDASSRHVFDTSRDRLDHAQDGAIIRSAGTALDQQSRSRLRPPRFVCHDSRALPLYGAMDDAPAGLYLGLLHGRDQVDTEMDDMGYPGPAIGPLCEVRTAYAAHLYLRFDNPQTFKLFFPRVAAKARMSAPAFPREVVINVVDSTIPYDGRFFGDWVVFNHDNEFNRDQ